MKHTCLCWIQSSGCFRKLSKSTSPTTQSRSLDHRGNSLSVLILSCPPFILLVVKISNSRTHFPGLSLSAVSVPSSIQKRYREESLRSLFLVMTVIFGSFKKEKKSRTGKQIFFHCQHLTFRAFKCYNSLVLSLKIFKVEGMGGMCLPFHKEYQHLEFNQLSQRTVSICKMVILIPTTCFPGLVYGFVFISERGLRSLSERCDAQYYNSHHRVTYGEGKKVYRYVCFCLNSVCNADFYLILPLS